MTEYEGDGVALTAGLGTAFGDGFIAGSGLGVVSFIGGRETGAGFIAGSGWEAVSLTGGSGAGAGATPPLVSDETVAAPDGETAAAFEPDGAATSAAAAPELAPADAPLAPAAYSALSANARGTAKTSDNSTAKRNNLFIIIPPKTLIDFY
jgi:hypothetical protein